MTIKGIVVGAFVGLLTSATIVVFGHISLVDATRWAWWVFFVYLTGEWFWNGTGKRRALQFFAMYDRKAIVNSYLLVAITGALLATLYWVLINQIYDAALNSHQSANTEKVASPDKPASPSPDITWEFSHFLGIHGGGGMAPCTVGFQLYRRNNLDRPILHIDGVWRSDITNEAVPILLEVGNKLVRPEETNGIPPKAPFHIYGRLPQKSPPCEGLNDDRFLRDYASVTLDLTYDGNRMLHHFTSDDVWEAVENFRRSTIGSPTPGITKKNQ